MNTITKEAYEGDIVSRLRNWRGLHIAHSGRLYEEAADEIERLRLTVEERDSIECAVNACEETVRDSNAATLRALLERTK